MHKYFLFLTAGLLCVTGAGCVHAQDAVSTNGVVEEQVAEKAEVAVPESTETPNVPKLAKLPVAVVCFGDVDDALAQRAQKWAQDNLAIPVPLLPSVPAAQFATFEEVTAAATAMMETNRVGLVVLWHPTSSINNHGAHYPELHVAVANLNPMLTPDTDSEKIERRVERQVVRGICMLMGLEPSPNPYSAMFNYSNLEELDAIGRNLDPPWLKRLQEKAIEYGIPVDKESVFNMTN